MLLFLVLLLVSMVLSVLVYQLVTYVSPGGQTGAVPVATVTKVPTAITVATPGQKKSKTILPVQDPSKVLGVEGDPTVNFTGIPWVRLGYPSCGWGKLRGSQLQDTIEKYHKAKIRVLLTVCQTRAQLLNAGMFSDAAQGGADAVQCGNEQMKQDQSVSFLYLPPDSFARFYDLCERAVHAVRSDIPVLLGSLDPHVSGDDDLLIQGQVDYLNQMQDAMNTSVRKGSNWDWHRQILGLIDSWHNGYPDSSVNNLQALFSFWANQFNVDLNSGQLGKHLWVVEGTGCFKGCGVDDTSSSAVAISHILTLTTDVQTAMQYKVPFFYFSGRDFHDQGTYWPIGVLNNNGHAKPLRQDLPMGSRSLTLNCPSGKTTVKEQLPLLAQMYSGCALPDNYVTILTS